MRAALLCLVLATGCAGGADAALTAEDAKSKLAVKDNALTRLAQTQLSVIAQQAQQWSATHGGSMAGFADDLRTSQPSAVATAVELTDTSVTVAAGPGQCLTAALPAGAAAPVAC
jgi:hypothetical protein